MSTKKLMLIDGNSLLYRAFYALPLLHNSEGVYTNGVYGFLTMFNRVMDDEQPTHIVVAFDKDRVTFRNHMYSDYKANRAATPDELTGQFQLLREVLRALNVTYLEMQGYEADDIIGTLSSKASREGMECIIVTGDSDTLQLVSDRVKVIMTRKGITETETYDPRKVKGKWQVDPEQLAEIKGLMGDASDNIPGVPGVGPKTAMKLIAEFSSLENLYEHLDLVKGAKLVEKLKENRDQAFMSRELGTVLKDMEIEFSPDDWQVEEPDWSDLIELYKKLEFNSLLKTLQENHGEKQSVEYPDCKAVEINSRQEFQEIVDGLQQGMAVLIETDYHHPMWGQPQSIYLAGSSGVYRISLKNDVKSRLEWVKPLLESTFVPKYMHNAKFARVILLRFGIDLQGVVHDTMLLAYVRDPVFNGEKLDNILFKYLNIKADDDNYAFLAGKVQELSSFMSDHLPQELNSLYYNVEMPLSDVLADMEHCGIMVDRETLLSISEELAVRIEQDENRIFELAGSEFNINSPKQLGKVLFEDLGLKPLKKTKTGYATGAEVLEQMYEEHQIIPYILDYRQLSKLKSTYADALQNLIHPDTGRVHTIFKQAQTATGRLSSVEPNLQNIPIRMEEGRRIRRAFMAGNSDYVIMSADYSQIDLRSLAHISGDETLIDTFKKGIDIHTRTAAEIFNVPIEMVHGELRQRAKAVNFGIIYGISDFGLARDTGVSRKEARIYIDNYLDKYPGVKKYMDDIVEFGKSNGYVETILKRRRYLPDLNARNRVRQSLACRMALNTPIQGTSADIIKLAMIDVYRRLQELNSGARLLLQVHDELVLEVPEKEVAIIARMLKKSMESAYELKVPLEVSLKIGHNWYDMKEIKVD